jgi:Ca2+-binding EF-hand superfamily protein
LAHLADSLAHLHAAIVQEHAEQRKVQESANRVLTWRFDAWDADKSGAIDRKELKDAFGKLALEHSDLQISEMFDKADKNNDGKLTVDEFQKARHAPS